MLCSVSTFGLVLLFLIVGGLFALISLSIGKLVRPNRPSIEKLATYECGEETIIGAWGKFSIRFYLIALIFVLFEVEIIFLFPWAKLLTNTDLQTLNPNWKIYAFTEGILFIFILVIGLAYLWKNKLLDGKADYSILSENKPEKTQNKALNLHTLKQRTNEKVTTIPTTLYEEINNRYS